MLSTLAAKLLVIACGLALGALIHLCAWWYAEKSTRTSMARSLEKLARHVNLPRLPDERLSVWTARLYRALDELSDASTEFMAAAAAEGEVERRSDRGFVYKLPPEHPASIRLAQARGETPDAVPCSPYRGLQS